MSPKTDVVVAKNIAFIVNSLSDFDFIERNQKYEYECE